MGGLTTGGLNFDAKCRRESFEPVDLFHAHIGGMDAFARGLKVAHAMIEDGRINTFIKQRYATFDTGIGAKIEKGEVGFEELEAHVLANGEPLLGSGRQEMLENLVNEYL
jgi:xylose isomerase